MTSGNGRTDAVARKTKLMTLLRRHRLSEGLTLAELGKRLGVTAGAVQAWECGRFSPRPRHVPKLAKALGLKPFQLMEILSPEAESNAVNSN